MFSRSSWLHLRIPFSYFLLPVFLFSLALTPNLDAARLFWVFVIVHLLLYPASNGYNSYFDKDEESIGGLKHPPPVAKELFYIAWILDIAAVLLGYFLVNATFAIMLVVYGLVSKAYSHPAVRLKKYAVAGWISAGFFQGFFTLLMCYIGLSNFSLETALQPKVVYAGILTSAMLLGNYPMTQIYQHEEDLRRGDRTFSIALGVMGTFYFVAGVFVLVTAGFALYFIRFFEWHYVYAWLISLLPVLVYFNLWMLKARKDKAVVNYDWTMRLNFISATCLNLFFVYLFLRHSQVLQTLSLSGE